MTKPNELSISQASQQLRSGQLTAAALVKACLDRMAERESTVQAWVGVYAEQALAKAKQLDAAAAKQHWQGPLHGIPLGIKDIFDVENMTTRAGTSAYEARLATTDAQCVAWLRRAGAIILGKTVTTAFAMGDAGPTCNPWLPTHTPGGSSSGSGAAVADRMCLAALGSQTVGSVIRPASFNGVVGFKPSHGRISVQGVIPLSWQLDHVGSLNRSVADAWLLWQLMRQPTLLNWSDSAQATLPSFNQRQPQRLWRLGDVFTSEADPEIAQALAASCQTLAAAGVEISTQELPFDHAEMAAAHRTIMASEAASYHKANYLPDPDRYPPIIGSTIAEGLNYSATDYVDALRYRQQAITKMQTALSQFDAAIMPAATGPAPEGLDFTGDRLFNVLSSFCGLPVVSLPISLSSKGLPLSIQLMGHIDGEDTLLAKADWCEQKLPFKHSPP